MMEIIYRALQKMNVDFMETNAAVRRNADSYADFADVSDYAVNAVEALASSGLVNGKSGCIAPTDYTTRPEAVVLIKRIIDYVK